MNFGQRRNSEKKFLCYTNSILLRFFSFVFFLIFIILVFAQILSAQDRFQKFQEFRQKYGKEWISLWEKDNPKLIFGGKFSSQSPKVLKPELEYKDFKQGLSAHKFSPVSVTSENEKLIIIGFDGLDSFSPNGDGISDKVSFTFQNLVSATDACGNQGETPHECELIWKFEIKECKEGGRCEVKRRFEGAELIPKFSTGERNKIISVSVEWDGKDEEGNIVNEGVYFWHFEVKYVRRTEICHNGCMCGYSNGKGGDDKGERCFEECFYKRKEIGKGEANWEVVVDITPPKIEFLGPQGISGEEVKIKVGYEDNLAGVLKESFVAELNGEDVSARFYLGESEGIWEAKLEEGEKYIRFWISDRAGNMGDGEGRFKVLSWETMWKVGVARDFLVTLKDVYGFREELEDLEVDWNLTERRAKKIEVEGKSLEIETTFVKFVQRYEGIPVLGGNLSVIIDDEGMARGVYGRYFPSIDVSTRPVLSSDEAKRIVKNLGEKELFGEPELWVYPGKDGYHLSWLVKGKFWVNYRGEIVKFICECITSPCPCDRVKLMAVGVFIDALNGRFLGQLSLGASSNLVYAPASGYVFPNDWTEDNQRASLKDLPNLIAGLYIQYACGMSWSLDPTCCLVTLLFCPAWCWRQVTQMCGVILPLNPDRFLLGDMGGGITGEVKTSLIGTVTSVARADDNWFYNYPFTSVFEINSLEQERNRVEAGFREVNVYYHLMKALDKVRNYGEKITAPLYVEATRVDPRICDAAAEYNGQNHVMTFFNGDTTRCIPSSWSGDVIYHEFGHVILHNYRFFPQQPVSVLSGFHEGIADYISVFVDSDISNFDPIIGEGFQCGESSCSQPNYIRSLEDIVRQITGGNSEILTCSFSNPYYICNLELFARESHEYGISIGGALFRSLYHFIEKANSMGKGKLIPYILFHKAFFDALYHMAGQNMVVDMGNYGEFVANLISIILSQNWGDFEILKVILYDILTLISVNQFITLDLDALSGGTISTIIVKKPYVGVGRWINRPPEYPPVVTVEPQFVFSSPPTLVGFLGTMIGEKGGLVWRVRLATFPELFSNDSGRNENNYFETEWFPVQISYSINFSEFSSPRNITYYFFEYSIPQGVFDRFTSSVPYGQNVKIYVLVEVDYYGGTMRRDSILRFGDREIYYYFEAPGRGSSAGGGGGGGGGGGCRSFYLNDLFITLLSVIIYFSIGKFKVLFSHISRGKS